MTVRAKLASIDGSFDWKGRILFFVNSNDVWYVQDDDVVVSYDENICEIEFNYVK